MVQGVTFRLSVPPAPLLSRGLAPACEVHPVQPPSPAPPTSRTPQPSPWLRLWDTHTGFTALIQRGIVQASIFCPAPSQQVLNPTFPTSDSAALGEAGAAPLQGLSTRNKSSMTAMKFFFLRAWKAAFISSNTDGMTSGSGEVCLLGAAAPGPGEGEFTVIHPGIRRGTLCSHQSPAKTPRKPEPHPSNKNQPKVLFL